MSQRRIRLGMVGGGAGGFIGGVHRMAARLDGCFDLVAGALSSDPARAAQSARDLGIAPDRSYASFQDMAQAEAARPDGIEAVSVVTPNHLHAPAAIAFLRAGIHVICDKPLALTLDEGATMADAAQASGARFILTHNYTGYPLIRQARAMVAQGLLGKIRQVRVEYAQDWLATAIEQQASGAAWRTDPARAGLGGAIGDIGSHAYQLMRSVTGLEVETLQAQLTAFVPGRALDDDAEILLRFKGGARGSIWVSQVAVGHANDLRLRIYGETGSLSWSQEDPDRMIFGQLGQPSQILTRGGAGLVADAIHATRVPAGHPEGYIEAFANLYRDAAALILRQGTDKGLTENGIPVPGLEDGLDGLRFIQAAVRSSAKNGSSEPL